jgi:hypothetical protein
MANKLTAQEVEMVVRAAWKNVEGSPDIYGYTVTIKGIAFDMFMGYESLKDAWEAAHVFTVQRLQEIARYQPAQDWLNEFVLEGDDADVVPVLRELVTEKLAELKRWMK